MTARRNMTKAAWAALSASDGPGTPVLVGQRRRHPFGAVVTVSAITQHQSDPAPRHWSGTSTVVAFGCPSLAGHAPARFVQTWELVR